MIKTKKQMYLVIGAFALVMLLGSVTYAFFNYTRTGGANTIQVGRIAFATNQADTIALTNAFPITRTMAATDTTNTDDVVITISGDTDYSGGVEYLVTATNVTNTIGSGNNAKTVPISIIATASNLGTPDEEYFDNRGSNAASSIYKVLAKQTISNNDQLLVGYIKSGATGVNGSITIRAYLDSDLIAISDTYNGTDTAIDNMGTTSTWVNGRTNFTTTEWNDISVSFKIKVEANEGTWVEEVRSVNAMNTFPTTITDQKTNIKEVYFNKMGATAMRNAYDAATIKADLTYNNEGKVLAWLETNTTDNTKYNLIVASDGDTYLTTGQGLFAGYENMQKIEFNNVDTVRITSMMAMFNGCNSITNLNLSHFGSNNLTTMQLIFDGCNNLTNVNMSYFDFGKTNFVEIFHNNGLALSNLQIISLKGANLSQITNLDYAFQNLSNLQTLDLSNIYLSNSLDMRKAFEGCSSLTELDLSSFSGNGSLDMFSGCSSLTTVYVSDKWDVSNQPSGMPIFGNNTSLVGTSPNGTTYAFDSSDAVDKTYAVIAADTTKGYLTDISLKPTN